MAEPGVCLGGTSPTEGYETVYPQKTDGNAWQAESAEATDVPFVVDWIDWGDNLESVDWTTRSKIRTEVVLLKNVVLDPSTEFAPEDFLAFAMSGAVPGTENSPVEMHGTNYGGPENPDFGTQTLIDPTLVRPGFQATIL